MPEVVASVMIAAPPEAVWPILCDPHLYPELADPTDRMLHVDQGPMRTGYTYREYGGVPPFKGESTWRVTTFEPVHRQVHVGDDGAMTMDLEIELEPIDGGTRYTQRLGLTPRWWLWPVTVVVWPVLLRRRTQRAMDRTVLNFKRKAESDTPEPGASTSPPVG